MSFFFLACSSYFWISMWHIQFVVKFAFDAKHWLFDFVFFDHILQRKQNDVSVFIDSSIRIAFQKNKTINKKCLLQWFSNSAWRWIVYFRRLVFGFCDRQYSEWLAFAHRRTENQSCHLETRTKVGIRCRTYSSCFSDRWSTGSMESAVVRFVRITMKWCAMLFNRHKKTWKEFEFYRFDLIDYLFEFFGAGVVCADLFLCQGHRLCFSSKFGSLANLANFLRDRLWFDWIIKLDVGIADGRRVLERCNHTCWNSFQSGPIDATVVPSHCSLLQLTIFSSVRVVLGMNFICDTYNCRRILLVREFDVVDLLYGGAHQVARHFHNLFRYKSRNAISGYGLNQEFVGIVTCTSIKTSVV